MKLKIVNWHLVSVPVPFRLSWGRLGYSRHLFITLADDKGRIGEGEGVLYRRTFLEVLPFLEKLELVRSSGDNFVAFEPALAFAVDTAIRDIKGEIEDVDYTKPVIREVFLEAPNLPALVEKYLDLGTKVVKLKVGAGVERDKKTIALINRVSRGELHINLDANRAYNVEEALELASWGKQNNVELFEEPVNGDFNLVREFHHRSNLPVMLDESILNPADLDQALRAKCFDVLNLKLSRLGGITLAADYIRRCQVAGVKIYLGCSEELTIGTKAILSLAKRTPGLYGVEGFGQERLAPYLENAREFRLGGNNRWPFLALEFTGVWLTKIENGLNL